MLRSRESYALTLAALLIAVLCWGLAPVATRYMLFFFSPLQLVIVRFLFSAVLFLPLLYEIKKQHWTRSDLALALLCGLVGVIGYHLIVAYGIRLLPASTAGVIIATEPAWIILLSLLVLRERAHWSVLLGLALAGAGVLTLLGWDSLGRNSGGQALVGAGLTLLAAVLWAIYTLAVRPLSRKYGARTCTALTMGLGALPLFAFSDSHLLANVVGLSSTAWLALFLLVAGSTVLATILWNYGVARIPGAQAGLFLYFVPFISVAGGSIFLHERLTATLLVSGILIIAGIAVAQTQQLSLAWHKQLSLRRSASAPDHK